MKEREKFCLSQINHFLGGLAPLTSSAPKESEVAPGGRSQLRSPTSIARDSPVSSPQGAEIFRQLPHYEWDSLAKELSKD